MSSEIKSTTVQTNSLKDKTGTRTLASDSGSAWNWGSGLPSGSIVQVQYTQYGDGSSETGNMSSLSNNTNYVLQASGSASGGSESGILDVNITPKIYGSKIWLQCHWMGELKNDQAYDMVWFFWRDTTKLAGNSGPSGTLVGEAGIGMATQTYKADLDANSTPETLNMQYFDTHGQTQSQVNSGTQITYKVGFAMSAGVNQVVTNRTIGGTHEVGVSSICAIELAP